MIKKGERALREKQKKNKEKRTLAERLAIDVDMPPELLSGGCFIEIRGRNSVVVRGCRRILTYSETKVSLRLKRETVEVTGKRLTCISYLAGAVSVAGYIDSVSFLRREDREV